MRGLVHRVSGIVRDDKGAALAEWGLLVVLIAVVAMIGVQIFGNEVSGTYSEIASTL